jgi:nucleoside 2-deoxyribosyltransferase
VGNPPPVYLAGPDVFLPDSAEIGRRKQAICAAHGLDGSPTAAFTAFELTVQLAAAELGAAPSRPAP